MVGQFSLGPEGNDFHQLHLAGKDLGFSWI